ncbi:MAG: flagellar hook-length control protein FliK [Woeseiaceae bacterium]|nr:flagellar hook-length control protein FliK [Woeseiaceae bacterium]
MLQLRLDELPSIELEAGDVLPPGGSALPPEPDVAPLASELLTPQHTVADDRLPTDSGPEISLPGIEIQLAAAAETLVPMTTERVAQPATDNLAAAAREVLREAEPPRPVPPAVTRAPAAVETIISDNVDIEAPLVRPLAEMRAGPGHRRNMPVVPEAATRESVSATARESQSQAFPAATPSHSAMEVLRDESGFRIQNLQALTQNAPQAFVTQAHPAQLGPTTAAPAQPFATEMTASSLPGQAALIDTPVADAAWGDRLGERVLLMAGNQLRSAELRLTPAELGPVRVQVAVDDGTANITFHAQHAVTRDAIEQALPRLREMLAENGLSLGQANVGEQGVAGQEHASRDGVEDLVSFGAEGDEAATQATTDGASTDMRARVTNGLVDTFV